jgi:hypothetical protein
MSLPYRILGLNTAPRARNLWTNVTTTAASDGVLFSVGRHGVVALEVTVASASSTSIDGAVVDVAVPDPSVNTGITIIHASVHQHQSYLGAWAYTGCGTDLQPCPTGPRVWTPHAWTVENFMRKGGNGTDQPWVNLLVSGGGNQTAFAELQVEILRRSGESLPVLWQWNGWRTANTTSALEQSFVQFKSMYKQLARQFSSLPPSPFGIFLGDEPTPSLVMGMMGPAAALAKHAFPNTITYVNLQFKDIVNATVARALGEMNLSWVGSDDYYQVDVATYREAYSNLLYPNLRPEQKVVLMPLTTGCEFKCAVGPLPLAQLDAHLLSVAEQHHAWAAEDNRVAGVIAYHLNTPWQPTQTDECENPGFDPSTGKYLPDATSGGGVSLTDRCTDDAPVTVASCNGTDPVLAPSGRLQWVLGAAGEGTFVLGASTVADPLCLSHNVQPRCLSPYNTSSESCYLGEPSGALSVVRCNKKDRRQKWSCVDSANCTQPGQVQSVDPACRLLPNASATDACCLSLLSTGEVALQSCESGFALQGWSLQPIPPSVSRPSVGAQLVSIAHGGGSESN